MSHIIVKARSDHGRWRAGRHFTRTGVELAVADLTAADLDALRRDPELVITGDTDTAAEAAAQAEAAQAAAEAAAQAEAAQAAAEAAAQAEAAQAAAEAAAQAEAAKAAGKSGKSGKKAGK